VRRPSAHTLESAALFALAFLITTLAHEASHAAMGLWLGRGPTMFTSSVAYAREVSDEAQMWTALTGPMLSLASGAALFFVARIPALPPRARLMTMWLAYHGLVNFVGYVFTSWFAPTADMGRAMRIAGATTPTLMALTALGYAGIRFVARPFGRGVAELSPTALAEEAEAKTWAKESMVYAGALATPFLVLAALPVPHWLSLMYVLTCPLALLDLPKSVAAHRAQAATAPWASPRPTTAWAITLCAWVVARLVFDGGVVWAS
jgi:hypothetical protein